MKTLITAVLAITTAAAAMAAQPEAAEKPRRAIQVMPRYLPSASLQDPTAAATTATEDAVELDKFLVTGSLLPKPQSEKVQSKRPRSH